MFKFNYTGIPHQLKIWVGMFVSDADNDVRISRINILIGYLKNLKLDHLSII